LYSEKGYYLNSVADKVFVNPKGGIEFNGLNAQYTFFKNLLAKIGVEPQIFYDGKFKSATEPFRLDSMSAENELMTRELLNDIHQRFMSQVAASRNTDRTFLDSVNNYFLSQTAHDAVRYHLADSAIFIDQVYAYFRNELGIGEKEKIQFISLNKYLPVPPKTPAPAASEKIAILFAQGDIVDGRGNESNIGSTKYVEQLRKLREDEKVKAIVFRVNSGGGSALASDVIAREVEITVKEKPLVISMGDYAASGGYYLAAPASKIMAQPNTLTGSIGVFGIVPNMQKLFEEKLGLTFDNVKTGKYADFLTVTRPLKAEEKKFFQDGVDTIYAQFKATVVKGRKLDPAVVDSIAQGRVWTGTQALKWGLVDSLGGLREAIAMAARLASVTEYRITQHPERDDQWEQLMKMFSKDREAEVFKTQLGMWYPMYKELESLASMQGYQTRLLLKPEIE
jgi:protease-4